MRIRWSLSLAVGLLLAASGTAIAQGAGKTGVTMGYPASIGIVWHATDKVAIRPELSLSGDSAETSGSSFETDSDALSLETGASVLFYLHTYEHLKTYFSPRFTYSRTRTTFTSSGVTTASSKGTSTSTGVAGSFGAQYALGDKFSVFGEVGFGVSHQNGTSSTSSNKATGNSWATRAGVGVIFYP
jgi:hypothetical protein